MRHQGRCHFSLITVSAGLVAASVSSFAADAGARYSVAIAVPAHTAPAARRPLPAHPIDPPDTSPDRSVQHARIVDQLYDQLMRSSGCLLTSSNAAIAGGCRENAR
jgi:hypothetical protein